MKHFLTLLSLAIVVPLSAQVNYPYNPDENSDTFIGSADLTGFLSNYGNAFYPSEIMVEEQPLSLVLAGLQAAVDSLSQTSSASSGSVLDMPVGTILPVASSNVPDGWMLCDGREIPIEEYQGLYDLIGTTYGAGDSAFWSQVFYPATTFNIPDLRGRTIIGANDMGGEDSEVLTTHDASVGQIGGAETHLLDASELPEISFSAITAMPSASTDLVYNGAVQVGESEIQFGGGVPHNNMQPFLALNYMIKVQGAEGVVEALEELILSQQTQLDEILEGPTVYRATDLEVFISEGHYRRVLPDDADVIINDAGAMWILECPNPDGFRELKILSSTVDVIGQDFFLGHPNDDPSSVHYFQVDGTWISN